MKIVIVDENNEVIGYKERDDRSKADIVRVSGLWLVNERTEVLIAQRALSKVHDPGKWGPSAAGTVEEGESYETNIIKEANEELGVNINESDLIFVNEKFVNTSHRYFCQIFIAKVDLPIDKIKVQESEVEKVRWVSIADLAKWFKGNPDDFSSSFRSSLEDLKKGLN